MIVHGEFTLELQRSEEDDGEPTKTIRLYAVPDAGRLAIIEEVAPHQLFYDNMELSGRHVRLDDWWAPIRDEMMQLRRHFKDSGRKHARRDNA